MDFEAIWEDQLRFNRNFFDPATVQDDKDRFAHLNNFYTLAAHKELSEALDTVHWKIHRREYKKPVKSNTLEEFIDVFKYWMTLMQLHGFTPEEIEAEYYRKSAVVEQRHLQEVCRNLQDEKDVVAVDIDGVLADYPRSFLEFINQELGTTYTIDQVTTYDIYGCLGIPPEIGLSIKNKYRETGQKRFIPVLPGAKEFLLRLKAAGYTIVLITARPYEQYSRIYADTLEWLARNDLPYDYLVFHEKKEEYLIDMVGKDAIRFFVDDVVGNANSVSRLGIPCYLITRPYNMGADLKENVTRINKLEEIRV